MRTRAACALGRWRRELTYSCMHYRIEWAGERWVGHDTWEPLESLQTPRVKAMVNEFNQGKRARTA